MTGGNIRERGGEWPGEGGVGGIFHGLSSQDKLELSGVNLSKMPNKYEHGVIPLSSRPPPSRASEV